MPTSMKGTLARTRCLDHGPLGRPGIHADEDEVEAVEQSHIASVEKHVVSDDAAFHPGVKFSEAGDLLRLLPELLDRGRAG